MKVIVLGAGLGSRLLPLTSHIPKPMLRTPNGETILQRLVGSLREHGISQEVVIVGGHLYEKLHHHVVESVPGAEAIFNPFYALAGPLGSLWLAQRHLEGDDYVIVNGDTVYHDAVFARVGEQTGSTGIRLVVAENPRPSTDDMLVALDQKRRVIGIGKDLAPTSRMHVSAGILLVQGQEARDTFLRALRELVTSELGALERWTWHSTLNRIVAEGFPVGSLEVEPGMWQEIDTIEDLQRTDPFFT